MHQIYILHNAAAQTHSHAMITSRQPFTLSPVPSPAIIVCWKGNVKETPEPTQPEHQRTCVLRYVVVANVG